MKHINKLLLGSAVASIASVATLAADYTLRVQTHYGPETVSGKYVKKFVEDVNLMSSGRLEIEMFYSSSVVKSVETFDAAATGILDGDMTGGAYQTGKNPAFQFVGDILGGYDDPFQFMAFLQEGGGRAIADDLYGKYGMHLVGWWPYGQESLTSKKPLRGYADLKDWKFRSPPGLETEIFDELGAKPIVMDFTEVYTALQSGIIDGADASSLANNEGLGLLEVGKHATFPGFHSMPADHLTINKEKWNSLPRELQRIVEVAFNSMALENILTHYVTNFEAAQRLQAEGVTLYNWSDEDRKNFRKIAAKNWDRWGEKTPEARKAVDAHIAFMTKIGLIE